VIRPQAASNFRAEQAGQLQSASSATSTTVQAPQTRHWRAACPLYDWTISMDSLRNCPRSESGMEVWQTRPGNRFESGR